MWNWHQIQLTWWWQYKPRIVKDFWGHLFPLFDSLKDTRLNYSLFYKTSKMLAAVSWCGLQNTRSYKKGLLQSLTNKFKIVRQMWSITGVKKCQMWPRERSRCYLKLFIPCTINGLQSNSPYASDLPKHTRTTHFFKVLDLFQRCCIDNVSLIDDWCVQQVNLSSSWSEEQTLFFLILIISDLLMELLKWERFDLFAYFSVLKYIATSVIVCFFVLSLQHFQ